MTHDPVNEVMNNYNSNFSVHSLSILSSRISGKWLTGFIVTNWNKIGNIYCKVGKRDSLFVAYS